MAGGHMMCAGRGGGGVTPAQAALRSAADTDAMLDARDLGDPPAALAPATADGLAVPTLSEIIDGPVAPLDRVHAFDVLRAICRRAPRPVCSARARLTSVPEGGATPLAIAEVILVLDGGLVVAAGSEGTTMREAV